MDRINWSRVDRWRLGLFVQGCRGCSRLASAALLQASSVVSYAKRGERSRGQDKQAKRTIGGRGKKRGYQQRRWRREAPRHCKRLGYISIGSLLANGSCPSCAKDRQIERRAQSTRSRKLADNRPWLLMTGEEHVGKGQTYIGVVWSQWPIGGGCDERNGRMQTRTCTARCSRRAADANIRQDYLGKR